MWNLAAQTYRHNFPEAVVKASRLEDVVPARLRREIGKIDLLLASPECTNHSCAKGSAPRSEESRATAMQVLRFAKEFAPRWIILENVIQMRPWSRYGEMKGEIEALGYRITEMVLDASDYGVAQSRRRLYIVCGKGDHLRLPKPRKSPSKRSAKEILDRPEKWKMTPLFSSARSDATLERARRAFDVLGDQAPFLIVYYGSDGSGGWQPLDRPLRTVTTVDRFALVEPSTNGHQMRMLQVPELTRAMGFGRQYDLPLGTRRQKIHILGNGVCPPVMKALVSSLMKIQ